MNYDHILLIGFGGPSRPDEVRPFIEQVAQGRNIPESRLREVEHHYEMIGGASPYNQQVFGLAAALRESMGGKPPIFVGMRNWHPFLHETLEEIKAGNLRKGLGVILAPHRSLASCKRYKQDVEEARQRVGATEIHYEYLETWYAHPLFIEAHADLIKAALPPSLNPSIIFTAHSIPQSMAAECPHCDYAAEFHHSSKLVAERLGHSKWACAYQSRSGNPRDPWLEPDILSTLRRLKEEGENEVLAVPAGFLCENAEILYDLDIETQQEAKKIGMHFRRASTVMQHPKFISMLTELIAAKTKPLAT